MEAHVKDTAPLEERIGYTFQNRKYLDIALTQGLDRVSVPRIAQRAGVSVGLVQHYFPAKAALVVTAYEALAARVEARAAKIPSVVASNEEDTAMIKELRKAVNRLASAHISANQLVVKPASGKAITRLSLKAKTGNSAIGAYRKIR